MVFSTQDLDPKAFSKDVRWFIPTLGDKLTPKARRLFEDCGITEGLEEHIYQVRDEAWQIFPFPCIGNFWFLQFGISQLEKYPEIVRRLTSAPEYEIGGSILEHPERTRYLDIGTCLGQDLRLLRADGVPACKVYGSDLFPEFETLGNRLFRDQQQFIAADVLNDGGPLNETAGLWDIVTANMFFHQFNLKSQYKIANLLVKLLRPIKGSMLTGQNTGQADATEAEVEAPFRSEKRLTVYRHSKASMTEMWEAVVREVGGSWKITCEYDDRATKARQERNAKEGERSYFGGESWKRITFCVERL